MEVIVMESPDTNHSSAVDLLRLFASLDVVLFHWDIKAFRPLAGFGLPFFLLVSYLFLLRSRKEQPFLEFVKLRFLRLVLPWLAWTLVYAAVIVVHNRRDLGLAVMKLCDIDNFLEGYSIDLWFIPFLFVTSMGLFALKRAGLKPDRTSVCIAALLAFLGAFFASQRLGAGIKPPLSQYVFAAPALFLAYVVAYAVRRLEASGARGRYIAMLLALAALALAANYAMQARFREPFPGALTLSRWTLVASLTIVALVLRPPRSAILAKLGGATFGVYLCHPLFAEILRKLLKGGTAYLLGGGGLFVLALGFSLAMKKTILGKVVG